MDKNAVLKRYNGFTIGALGAFLWEAVRTGNKLRRMAAFNRLADYMAISGQPDLIDLHRAINLVLVEARSLAAYDYGEGYFYQGFKKLHITGFRNTEARYGAMELKKYLAGKNVLDIGCNSGFLSLYCAETARRVTGIEYNPYLIDIAKLCAGHLKIDNVEFQAKTFEDFAPSENPQFDAVLSFANHSTYDQQTRHTLEEYFDKCKRLLSPDGLFLFESHAPDYEGDKLEKTLDILKERFTILHSRVLNSGSFLDVGRTYIVATNK